MTRQIINDDEGFPLLVNTFWGNGEENVQITECGYPLKGYVQMSRTDALRFFRTCIKRLNKQIKEDKKDPPWWQELESKEIGKNERINK